LGLFLSLTSSLRFDLYPLFEISLHVLRSCSCLSHSLGRIPVLVHKQYPESCPNSHSQESFCLKLLWHPSSSSQRSCAQDLWQPAQEILPGPPPPPLLFRLRSHPVLHLPSLPSRSSQTTRPALWNTSTESLATLLTRFP
jgi:hypothetical protein